MTSRSACFGPWLFGLSITVLLGSAPAGPAQVNSWISPASGRWDDPSWSLGVPPAAGQSVVISNANSKAVGIFPGTPAGLMTITNLTISGPSDTLNTLLLNFFGTSTPLRVLNSATIQANGRVMNLFSGWQIGVNGGDFVIANGNFQQEGGATIVTNGTVAITGGTAAITNGILSFSTLHLANAAAFVQSGGAVGGSNLAVHSGTFDLRGGLLSANGREVIGLGGGATFTHFAGTNRADIFVGEGDLGFSAGNGHYVLYGGLIESTQLVVGSSAPADGDLIQNGGVVSNRTLRVGGFNSSALGAFLLNDGTLASGEVSINNGHFFQAGGHHTVSGALSLAGFFVDYGSGSYFANYTLQGGTLACGSISQSLFGSFTHSSGTNNVSGDLHLNRTTYSLSGGTLAVSNTILDPGGLVAVDAFVPTEFFQSAGMHRITNTLICAGRYHLDSGVLIAPAVVLNGLLDLGPSPAAVLSNGISFELAGTISLHSSTQHLAAATVSGDAVIDFNSGNCQLAFANSSAKTWTPGATLAISNWNGSVTGGGTDQLFFGNTSGGLTPAQLQSVRFIQPAGLPAGTWFAQILASGEIVPTLRPVLLTRAAGATLVLEWPPGNYVLQAATNLPGPFVDLPVSSPFTNNTVQFPRRFFRLRL